MCYTDDAAEFYGLRAVMSQAASYMSQMESKPRYRSFYCLSTVLLARRLLQAANGWFGENIERDLWRYTDMLICFAEDGATSSSPQSALQRVLRDGDSADWAEHTAFCRVSGEIGLGCPDRNAEIYGFLEKFSDYACGLPFEVPSCYDGVILQNETDKAALKLLLDAKRPSAASLRTALTRRMDSTSRQLFDSLTCLPKYEKELLG